MKTKTALSLKSKALMYKFPWFTVEQNHLQPKDIPATAFQVGADLAHDERAPHAMMGRESGVEVF